MPIIDPDPEGGDGVCELDDAEQSEQAEDLDESQVGPTGDAEPGHDPRVYDRNPRDDKVQIVPHVQKIPAPIRSWNMEHGGWKIDD